MSHPCVSIILPAYNAGRYIDLAISSIRQQTFRDFELIVIDDGSRDDTLERIQEHAAEDARLRIVTRENRGLVATLNEGIGLARADLIARMDADDIAYPERLERQVNAFRDRPGLCLCGTAIDTLYRGRIFKGKPARLMSEGSPEILSIFYTILLHPTLMIDRRIAGDELYYDPAYVHAEDFDLIRRLTRRHPVAYVPEALLAYRQHDTSVSTLHRQVMRRTHMRIASENFRAYGFEGDLDALEAFALSITPETARRLGLLMASLRTQFRARAREHQESYEFGWGALFYLLHTMFVDAGETGLLRTFLNQTGGWHLIRRRERMLLRLMHANPRLAVQGLKASYGLHNFMCRFSSSPLKEVNRTLVRQGG